MVKPMMRQRKRSNKPHWRKRPQRKLQDQPMPESSVEFQNTYTFSPIETYQVCKHLDIFQAGREDIAGFVHREMAQHIGMELAREGLVKFDTEPDPMNCGIVIRARVDVIRPM